MERTIIAPKPVRHSMTVESTRRILRFGAPKSKDDTYEAAEEIRQILNRPLVNTVSRKEPKTPSPSYRSISNLAKPPSRTSCKKHDIECWSAISTCESTDSLS